MQYNAGELAVADSSEGWVKGTTYYSVSTMALNLNREEKKRLFYATLAGSVGLVPVEISMWPDIHAMIIVTSLVVVLTVCMLPAAWIGFSSSRLSTICRSADQLLRKQPCDREALKHACMSFLDDPNIKALSELPTDSPVPIDLLRRIRASPPKAATDVRLQLRTLNWLFLAAMMIACLVKIILVLVGK